MWGFVASWLEKVKEDIKIHVVWTTALSEQDALTFFHCGESWFSEAHWTVTVDISLSFFLQFGFAHFLKMLLRVNAYHTYERVRTEIIWVYWTKMRLSWNESSCLASLWRLVFFWLLNKGDAHVLGRFFRKWLRVFQANS